MELPCTEVFMSLLSGDVGKLWEYPKDKIKPFLPFLCKSVFEFQSREEKLSHQKAIHALLCEIEEVQKIKKYLQLDFMELKNDAVKEMQLIKKRNLNESDSKTESALVDSVETSVAIEFERGSEERQFRLVMSELLGLSAKVRNHTHAQLNRTYPFLGRDDISFGAI